MGVFGHDSDSGMTLVEVLATVIVLSIFISVMLSLVTESTTVSKQASEKQQAMVLAEDMMAQVTALGAQYVFDNHPESTEVMNGVTYTIEVTKPSSPPSWACKGVFAEVKVSWPLNQNGKKVVKTVDLEQLFAK